MQSPPQTRSRAGNKTLQDEFDAADGPRNLMLFVFLAVFLVLAVVYEGSWLKATVGIWGDVVGVLLLTGFLGWTVYGSYRAKLEIMRARGLVCGSCGKAPSFWTIHLADQTRICANCGNRLAVRTQPGTLRDMVTRLADDPTPGNRNAFCLALISSDVAVAVQSLPGNIEPGEVVRADGQFSVLNVRKPDGSVLLLVFADEEGCWTVPGAKAGFWLSGRVALEMAAANRLGVLVTTGSSATAASARVTRDEVAGLLARAS